MTTNLLIASGSLSSNSQSNILAQRAETAAGQLDDVSTTRIDPRDLDLQFCDGRDWEDYNSDVSAWQQEVSKADCYVFAVPVYNWSYTGVFKNMIDLIPPGGFGGCVAGLMGKGGTMKAFLMLQREMRSLMSYFGVTTLPETVFASNSDFKDGNIVSDQIPAMIDDLVQQTVTTARQMDQEPTQVGSR
ncbi:MAG: NADPH-dependent FMN reductase [Candidatus Nanohaloarchaea archaeon]|nr:NADPH-dependent FMN reductase [Candidatus Nanohaloarchaea archaeon]